ncbi:MAG: DUF111 family protein [Firmicutes bacterium]|nr:DUF111 family protein [Bacillota bacterium]
MKAPWLALFEEIAAGKITPQEALKVLPGLTLRELEEATLDLQCAVRQDFPEVIFAQGKQPEACAALFAELAGQGPVLCTRADAVTAQAVLEKTPGARYNARAQTIVWQEGAPSPLQGKVLVITAGTADLPWAEESVETLRLMGNRTDLLLDVGVAELRAEVDDMTGEEAGAFLSLVLDAGALDAYLTPITMKKSRAGLLLTVLCLPFQASAMQQIMLKQTSTLGVRREVLWRQELPRRVQQVQTPWGVLPVKIAQLEDGSLKAAAEYEAALTVARQQQLLLRTVLQGAECAALEVISKHADSL